MIQTETKEVNIRTIPLDLKTRDAENGGTEISGYALKFGVPSLNMGFTEFINSTALKNVDLSQTMLLYNHDFGNILARADAGNLTLKVDGTGLFFDANLPDTTLANDVVADIQAGNLKGCSFGFTLPDDGSGDTWTQDAQGNLVHTINQLATVAEISITAIPAYTQTSVAVQRSMENFKKGVKKRDMAEKENNENLLDAIKGLQEQVRALKDAESKADTKEKSSKQSQVKDDQDTSNEDENSQDQNSDKKKNLAKQNDKEVGKREIKPEVVPEANENEQGEVRANMAKDITPEINKKNEEVRNFEAYLRTGKRDSAGFDTTAGEAVIPSQVLDVMAQPEDPAQLSGYVTKVQVQAPTGKLPVLKKATAQLVSAAELAENPQLANATIDKVNYDVDTLRGALPISIEMTQDYADITGLLTQYVNDVKAQTEQHKIGAVLQTATAVAATSVDDVKNAFNTDLVNYGADRMFVVSESAYAWLDIQKDDNGRYLLQDSISAPTGKTLFGAPLVEVADDVLGAAGDKKIFVGSVKAFVLEAIKANLNVAWVRNEQFEQVLQVVLRADFEAADTDAGKLLTIGASSTTTSGK